MKNIFPLLVLTVLYSCSMQKPIHEEFVTIPVESGLDSSFDLSEIPGEVSYVKLATNDSCLIGDIDKVFCSDDFIIIGSDSKVIYFFHKDGTFSHRILRQGDGPEEYIRISDFDIDKGRQVVSVLDTRRRELIQYDWYGNFLKKKELDYWAIGVQQFNDSIGLLYSGNQTSPSNAYKFLSYDTHTLALDNRFYPISQEKSSYLHIHSANNFSKCRGEVLFCELYNDTIYSLSSSGCTPAFYLDFGEEKVPSSFFQEGFKNVMEFHEAFFKHDFSYGINSLANFSTGFMASCFIQKKKHFLYYDKNRHSCHSFTKLTDRAYLPDVLIDIADHEVQFYSDEDCLLMIANNEAYMENGHGTTTATRQELGKTKIDDNPIVRICKI